MKPKLSDIVDALDMHLDEATYYLDRQSGEVLLITDEIVSALNDGRTDLPDWMVEAVVVARRVAEQPDRHLELPSQWDIDEYSMMGRFAGSRESDAHCDALTSAIEGRGAFRRFKDTAHRIGQIDAWYAYKAAAMEQAAIDWLEGQGIDYLGTH